jgi:hypothetical protein
LTLDESRHGTRRYMRGRGRMLEQEASHAESRIGLFAPFES